MRIAMLADRLILGGLETHIIAYVNEFLRRGHRIFLYTAFIEPDLLAQIQSGDSFRHLNWSENEFQDLTDFAPDLIHSHPFTAIVKGHSLASALRKPFLVTMHEFYDFGLDKSALGYKIGEAVYKIIAIDQGIADFLRPRVTYPEKITVIYNGIDLDKFRLLPCEEGRRTQLGLHPVWHTITTVSRFDNGKERPVYQLLRCAPDLVRLLGGLNIVIVGGGSWYTKILEEAEALAKSGLNLRICVAGYQADVRPYLAAADTVVACDRAAMEAMACGRPVFSANANGYAGLIDEGNFREILCDRQGYHELSDAQLVTVLVNLVDEATGVRNRAAKSRTIVAQHFSIAETASQLERLYEQAIQAGV